MVAAFPEKRDRAAPLAAGSTQVQLTEQKPVEMMLATRYTGPLDFATLPLTDDFAPVERYALMLLRQ